MDDKGKTLAVQVEDEDDDFVTSQDEIQWLDQIDKRESNCCRFKLGASDNWMNLFLYRCVFVHAGSFTQFVLQYVPACVNVFGCVCVSMCVFSAADDSRHAVLSAGRKRGGGGVCYFTRLP